MSENDFGEELRYARERAGLERAQLAETSSYSVSAIAQAERGEKPPTLQFAQSMDRALSTGGLLERIRERRLRHRVEPDWFRAYREIEQQATEIRSYEPSLIPGLLQTADYARALLGDDDRVAARMARQEVLSQAELYVAIDEAVLYRKVGGPEVMTQQLATLATTTASVQVLPGDADTLAGTSGGFVVAVIDGTAVGFVDTVAQGFVITDGSKVEDMRQRWERIVAESLPRSLSQQRITEVAEKWNGST